MIKTKTCLPRNIIMKLLKERHWAWERFCILICYGCLGRYTKITQWPNELLIEQSLTKYQRKCSLLTWWWIVLLLIWKELKFYWQIRIHWILNSQKQKMGIEELGKMVFWSIVTNVWICMRWKLCWRESICMQGIRWKRLIMRVKLLKENISILLGMQRMFYVQKRSCSLFTWISLISKWQI